MPSTICRTACLFDMMSPRHTWDLSIPFSLRRGPRRGRTKVKSFMEWFACRVTWYESQSWSPPPQRLRPRGSVSSHRGGYRRANLADIHPPNREKIAPEQLLNEKTSKSLWVHRSDSCPLLFQNLLRFVHDRLDNSRCRADCVHERCAFACGQAHFLKVTSRFRSGKDGSKLWHQIFPATKYGF